MTAQRLMSLSLMTITLSEGTPKCTVPTGYPAAWYLAKYVPRQNKGVGEKQRGRDELARV
jgi:ABC-type spermidine/putrescine transport system permease subunit I